MDTLASGEWEDNVNRVISSKFFSFFKWLKVRNKHYLGISTAVLTIYSNRKKTTHTYLPFTSPLVLLLDFYSYIIGINRWAGRQSVRSNTAEPLLWLESPSLFGVAGLFDRRAPPDTRCNTDTESLLQNLTRLLCRAHRWPSACRSSRRCRGWGDSDASKHRCLSFCADIARESRKGSGCTVLLPWKRSGGTDSVCPADIYPDQSRWSMGKNKWIHEIFKYCAINLKNMK